tara:strand:+ start:2116 stop:2667 length:552 start_codon:yes stop_codon:yes gene_type:complete
MKKTSFIIILLIMFNFKSAVNAKYEKIFFDMSIKSNTGEIMNLNQYKNNVILIVNTASYCGFTKQYTDMQKLWDKYKKDGLVVIGVPSNSFNQEKDEDSEIKEFCEVNFNINFPMTTITKVKGDDAHEIYKWARDNHGKSAVPKWNFSKILINKSGKVEETYSSLTNPMSTKVISKIESLLKN